MKLIECLAEYIKFYRKILITLCYQSSLANLLNFTWKWYRRSISGFTLADLKVHFRSFGKDFVAQLLVSLSQQYPLICVFFFLFYFSLWPFFYFIYFIIIGVSLPAYLSNHNPFSSEHIFFFLGEEGRAVGYNKFPSLVHRHRTSCFKSHPRRLGNVQ